MDRRAWQVTVHRVAKNRTQLKQLNIRACEVVEISKTNRVIFTAEYKAIVPGIHWASQVVLVVKNPPVNARDIRDSSLISESGRSPGGGHGNPLQYSCLENPCGQRSLVGYSPWHHKESDITKVT